MSPRFTPGPSSGGGITASTSTTNTAFAFWTSSSGASLGTQSWLRWDASNSRLGLMNSAAPFGALFDIASTKYVNNNCLRLRTDDDAFQGSSATGAIQLNAANDSGLSSIQSYNDSGVQIQAFSHDGSSAYAELRLNASIGVATKAVTSTITCFSIQPAPSQSADYLAILSSDASQKLLVIQPGASDPKLKIAFGKSSFPTNYAATGKVELWCVKYTDNDSFLMLTTDSSGLGSGTGVLRIGPALSSGLGTIESFNNDGFDFKAWNAAGNTSYGAIRFNSSGIKIDNTPIGFFAHTPHSQVTGGAQTAGLLYTATEQGMIQTTYDALRAYGLLT